MAVLLADDLVLGKSTIKEMIDAYQGGNMVAVMEVPNRDTSAYGIVTPGADDGRLVTIDGLVEKPTPEDAPSNIAVIGRYIIEPEVFSVLGNQKAGAGDEVQLTDALATRIGAAPFNGLRFSGKRFDCGSVEGFIEATNYFVNKENY